MAAPLQPARIDFSDAAAPRALDFDDVYHPRGGAFEQARHVFLAGNGLPQRWAGRSHFVILETGFGLGHNFLATWAAWRDDASRCEHLWFLSVDKHPPGRDDLRRAHAHNVEPTLASALVEAWPPLTPDLHRRDFAERRVHLLLALGDIADWLPQWVVDVDAFYLDGFAPAKNPAMWQPQLLKHLGRLAAPHATAATWSTARSVRDALVAADFSAQRRPGFDAKREMLIAHHAPHHRAPRPAGRRFGGAARAVAVVGAGLAGAATAQALAALGVPCTVFDAHAHAAAGGSGQPAGLLHGVVHADDSPHTRWYRAAALRAQAMLTPLLAGGAVAGRLDGGVVAGRLNGLVRLERDLDTAAMQRLLQAQGLPADYVQALSAAEAAARAGHDVSGAAWWYSGGGWIDPRSLVQAWLDHPAIECRLQCAVQRIAADGHGGWQLFDADGRTLAAVDQLVLANAEGIAALLGRGFDALRHGPLQRSRGQVTLLPPAAHGWGAAVPVAGDGYAIALPDGRLLCGATRAPDDDEPSLRAIDHRSNLEALQRLGGRLTTSEPDLSALDGRVGWRVHTRDRLPLLGGVPLDADARGAAARQDQPRFIARQAGLHLFAALGSRGLTQAALGGEVVAAMVTGTPLPIGSPLLDAVDTARFAARAARESGVQ